MEPNFLPVITNFIAQNNLSTGPNFFSYFAPYYPLYYASNVHPNTAGYTKMASLWSLPLMSPQNFTISQNNGTVTLNWNNLSTINSNINGYKIKYGTSSKNYTNTIDVGNVHTKNITGLTNGQKYYFSVSGYYSDSTSATINETVNSSEASITPISIDASLSSLTTSSGTLSPTFASGTTTYTESVSNSVSSMTVTPTVNQTNATVTINGTTVTSGSPFAINLNVGYNVITVVVTAQDGSTTDTYTITVARIAPKTITAFNFSSPAVTGSINESNHTIALTVPFDTSVTALSPTITITGASINPTSGTTENFTSPVTYTVTAADSSTQQYTVTVTVTPFPSDQSGGNITPTIVPTATTATTPIAVTSPTTPSTSSSLTDTQISSILSLLTSFGADTSTIANVQVALSGNQTATTSTNNSSQPTYAFTRNLSLNDTGDEVKLLQQFLNSHNFIIASTGPGSAGHEITQFGAKTYAALIRYQKSVGLPATGWFGPLTRKEISGN